MIGYVGTGRGGCWKGCVYHTGMEGTGRDELRGFCVYIRRGVRTGIVIVAVDSLHGTV